jgi:hypothetical protein
MAADTDLAKSEELEALGIGEINSHDTGSKEDGEADHDVEMIDMSNVDGVNNPLRGGTAADAALGDNARDESSDENPEDFTHRHGRATFMQVVEGKSKKNKGSPKWIWAWLPLTFPSVPKKVCIYTPSHDSN